MVDGFWIERDIIKYSYLVLRVNINFASPKSWSIQHDMYRIALL